MSAPLLGTNRRIGGGGKRGFSPQTSASLWRNGVGLAPFHHELNQFETNLRRDAAVLTSVALIHIKSAVAGRLLSSMVDKPTLERGTPCRQKLPSSLPGSSLRL
jgi:hypothetical protein